MERKKSAATNWRSRTSGCDVFEIEGFHPYGTKPVDERLMRELGIDRLVKIADCAAAVEEEYVVGCSLKERSSGRLARSLGQCCWTAGSMGLLEV